MTKNLISKNLKLTEAFGKVKDEAFDFEEIESFFRKSNVTSKSYHVLSDKTCNDLDFKELFMFCDRTCSKVGQQYFYKKLRTIPLYSSETQHEKLIEKFIADADFRLTIQNYLSRLNSFEAYYISSLFQDEMLAPPKWYIVIRVLSFINILNFVILFFVPKIFFVFLTITIVNLVIHYWNKRNINHFLDSIPQLLKMKGIAKRLFQISDLQFLEPDLPNSIRIIDKVRNRMSIFNLEVKLQNDTQALFWLILELIKIVFLIEPIFLFDALKRLDNKRREIEDVFRFVGEVDSLMAIASLRAGLNNYCIPMIYQNTKQINAEEVYHPLIQDCITNSILVKEKSILLTGSNMSGKTSFIRTIGINVITGLTLNTCFAHKFEMPHTRLYSAIRISDDLLNDKSYYFEEVLTIKEMIENSEIAGNNLFLLDEIFKGTNTVERISAGKAVLSELSRHNNIVFVSTHDIELADLLHDEFDLYHFSEIVADNTVDFDYKLKPGKLKNRNAIRILQLNQYPESVIKEAIQISKTFNLN